MKSHQEIVAEVQRFFGVRPRSRELKKNAVAFLDGSNTLLNIGDREGALALWRAAILTIRAYYQSGDVNVPLSD